MGLVKYLDISNGHSSSYEQNTELIVLCFVNKAHTLHWIYRKKALFFLDFSTFEFYMTMF